MVKKNKGQIVIRWQDHRESEGVKIGKIGNIEDMLFLNVNVYGAILKIWKVNKCTIIFLEFYENILYTNLFILFEFKRWAKFSGAAKYIEIVM